MLTAQLQKFVSDLIHQTHKTKAPLFKSMIMEGLNRLIPFDMALWASGHIDGLQVNNTYLYNLPGELMTSWEKIKHQDRLLQGLIRTPGKTFDVYDFYTRQERDIQATYQQHSKIFKIENAISTAIPDPDTGLLEIMSLYRSAPEAAFSSGEIQLKEFLFPLLTSSWHQNQIRHVIARAKNASGDVTAICDKRSWIRHAESDFAGLVRRQWPGWSGPVLPEEIAKWLNQDTRHRLKLSHLTCRKETLDDMILVQVRRTDALGLLTRREEEVAESFAMGLTYREIAVELGVSPNTVRRHIEAIYRKLQVASKVELFQSVVANRNLHF